MNWRAFRYWLLCLTLDALGVWALGMHAAWWWYALLGIGVAYIVNDIAGRR